jgi:integrase/recombinase XerC
MARDVVRRARPPTTTATRRLNLIAAFLAGRKPTTLKAYEGDLRDFATWAGKLSPGEACDWLFSLPPGEANHAALEYRANLVEQGLSSATVARRLGTLRSMSKCARMIGIASWVLEVESPSVTSYRDTTGPGDDGIRRMLSIARAETRSGLARSLRDLALVRVLHDLGLRRAEAAGLDLVNVERAEDGSPAALWIHGKGRDGRERITLPRPTAAALADWLNARGSDPGALFFRLDLGSGPARAQGTARLSGETIRRIVRDLGVKAELSKPTRPHSLRHQAITRALDLTGGDVRAVARFSRHRNIQILTRYDDNRKDLAGEVAALVAEIES